MKRSESFKKTLMFFVRRSIIVLMGGCFTAAWALYYGNAISNPFFRKGNWVVILIYMLMFYFLSNFYGGYRIGSQKITDTVYSNLLSLFIVNIITYFQITLINRWFLNAGPLLVATAVQICIIFVWSMAVTRFYFRIFDPVSLICLYGGRYPDDTISRFNILADKFKVVDAIEITSGEKYDYSHLTKADGIIISGVPDEKYPEILKFCVENNLRYYINPSIGDILLRTADLIYLNDMPLLLSKNEGLFFGQRCVKRIFDLMMSLIFIIFTCPLMLIAAICIKAGDGGSIIYRQKRCTQGGKVFYMLKFRSMREDAESDGKARLASEHDPRITPMGHFLRKYRIDELPQLFNILWGDMSFVGPRPERPAIIRQYRKTLPEFNYRLNVKCGLTGYAQVIGRYNTTPKDKLKLDLIYMQTYSLMLDIKIMLMTVKAVFSKESAQGIKE